jgi:hypothetical protein
MNTPLYSYPGSELDLFSSATNWKAYWARKVSKYIGSRVLEVGAGIGSTTEILCGPHGLWLALEPDPQLGKAIDDKISSGLLPDSCQLCIGTIQNLTSPPDFDTVLYIDVLEHIETDKTEIDTAASRLTRGGHLIVLAPAHQWLFTPFDEKIGHYRRYTRQTLLNLAGENLKLIECSYLDSVGLLASLANRLLLKTSSPSKSQIKVWDRYMVPFSVLLDPLFRFKVGKSVLVVWEKI